MSSNYDYLIVGSVLYGVFLHIKQKLTERRFSLLIKVPILYTDFYHQASTGALDF